MSQHHPEVRPVVIVRNVSLLTLLVKELHYSHTDFRKALCYPYVFSRYLQIAFSRSMCLWVSANVERWKVCRINYVVSIVGVNELNAVILFVI